MSVGRNDRLVYNLALMRGCETALPRKITELLVSKTHESSTVADRIIIE